MNEMFVNFSTVAASSTFCKLQLRDTTRWPLEQMSSDSHDSDIETTAGQRNITSDVFAQMIE
jgi:hypothetical protein